jgi:hypothetical protein
MHTPVSINYIAPADAIPSMLIQGTQFDKSILKKKNQAVGSMIFIIYQDSQMQNDSSVYAGLENFVMTS